MTVKELKEELQHYDDDQKIIFEVSDEIEVDSETHSRWGYTYVSINQELEPTFMGDVKGDMVIELGVKK